MSTPNTIQVNPQTFKKTWSHRDAEEMKLFLDDYFDRTADWTDSVRDMGLQYIEEEDYARFVIYGDFYVEASWLMLHFARTEDERAILVAEDDDRNIGFYILE